MRLLINTQVFPWAADSPETLSDGARDAIEDASNDVFVSVIAACEIAIECSKGKLLLPIESALFLPSRLRSLGFRALPLSIDHALAVGSLPDFHADPFDRLLIAQARIEKLILVTRDSQILRYPINTLLA